MHRFRVLMIAIVLLAASSPALAGPEATETPAQPRSTADVVKATITPAELTGAAGADVEFAIDLTIADTWHVYDHSYVDDEESFFIGVDLAPAEGADLAGFRVMFPAGEESEFMGEPVKMLHHVATVEVTVTLPPGASGVVEVPLTLTAQACDDKICLRPSDIPVIARVTVE